MVGNHTRDEKSENSDAYKHFEKVVSISLIAGIIVVSGFIIYYLVNPEPGYHTFTILNENKKMQNYPTNASIGEPIYFFVGVGNYFQRDLTFNVKILKGDNETYLIPNGPSQNAILNYTIGNYTIQHDFEWISNKLNISFYNKGEQIIIVELYEVSTSSNEKYLNKLFLRLNITN